MNILKNLYFVLIILFLQGICFANYVEVYFQGTIDQVDSGGKEIGEAVDGYFCYDIDAEGYAPGVSISYPSQTNFSAFVGSVVLDNNSLPYPYGTFIHLVDWAEEGIESFDILADGFIEDGNTNMRIECEFEAEDLFDSLYSLPVPPRFENATLSRFNFSVSSPGDLNTFTEKYSGVIESLTYTVHPETPKILILQNNDSDIVLYPYGDLQESADCLLWTSIPLYFGGAYTIDKSKISEKYYRASASLSTEN